MGHDLVDHCEPLVKLKLMNALENAKFTAALTYEEDDEDDGVKHRADMGFENFEYSELELPHDEREAKKLINEYFHKINGTTEPDDAVLDWRTRVNNYKSVVETILTPHRKLGVNFAGPRVGRLH
ncbi:unnamed protein product [Strongylus vulgaris]|uniref:Uncharacterized protein n=1 Tax=Strongylus vulgaris TaxID=40348 RepID=A0A3P7L319_STRVU|nr:unnamed protein product [Strongylus vulgaris]